MDRRRNFALHGLRLEVAQYAHAQIPAIPQRTGGETLAQGAEQTAQSALQNPGIPGADARRELHGRTRDGRNRRNGREDRRCEEPRAGRRNGSSSPEKGPGGICRTGQIRRRRRLRRRRDQGTPGQTPRRGIPPGIARTERMGSRGRRSRDPQGNESQGAGESANRGPGRDGEELDRRKRRPDRGR